VGNSLRGVVLIQASDRIGGCQHVESALADLRVSVLAAVHAGVSHSETGERFGVSAASVRCWRAREREQGDGRPKALGGDRRSKRIEACHEAVMAALGPDRDATGRHGKRRVIQEDWSLPGNEAHNFLSKSIGDDVNKVHLDAFGLIAKEGRKYGPTCLLSTHRPGWGGTHCRRGLYHHACADHDNSPLTPSTFTRH